MNRQYSVLTAVAVVAFGLSGCVNVLPKAEPIQLYRFAYAPETLEQGKNAVTLAPRAADGTMAAVNIGDIRFPQEAESDRVLTTEGNAISYVAGSRWAAPARQLFVQAVSEGFARSGTTVRLDPRGPAQAAYRLDLNVHHFESAYKHGRPTVSIALDAQVVRLSDRAVVGQRFITADVGVRRNDMSMMADAYNEATTQAVMAMVAFTQETVAANPVPDQTVTLPAATVKP
ncbi:MAG TPA: ABC-type transport auxiliary lipoprotein family protein [Asticcacaulis sp.]|nr:ABC-type transport auxiliary lipoprotein family protein [Asticcacaulis sp.]